MGSRSLLCFLLCLGALLLPNAADAASSCGTFQPVGNATLNVGEVAHYNITAGTATTFTATMDWGDRATSSVSVDPINHPSATLTHVYNAPGTFAVTLSTSGTLGDGTPCSDTGLSIATATIVAPPPPHHATQVPEPSAGAGAVVTVPGLVPPGSSTAVSVLSSAGDLKGTTIVGGETEQQRTVRLRQQLTEAVTACWLLGPDVITPPDGQLASFLKMKKIQTQFQNANPHEAIVLCLVWAHLVISGHLYSSPLTSFSSVSAPTGYAAANGCHARRFALDVRRRRGHITSVKLVRQSGRPPVGYSCVASGGQLHISIHSTRQGGLRKLLGRHLKLGAARSPTAPTRHATLTFALR